MDGGFKPVASMEMTHYLAMTEHLVSASNELRWTKLPPPQESMSAQFRRFAEQDRLVHDFDIALRHP